jgi:hypothetical protein
MPSRRSLPPVLGIIHSRTGSGQNRRAFRSARSSSRSACSWLASRTAWAVMPSTPAVRAPRLPRTRHHASSRTAGSQTRLNRSSNRRPGCWTAQRCSLVWIPSTRPSASVKADASSPVFTSALLAFQHSGCELAAALRHAAGFPDLGLLRRLRPARALPVDDAPAHPRPGRPGEREASGRFPRSLRDRSTGEVPGYAPAASPRLRRRPSARPPGRPH